MSKASSLLLLLMKHWINFKFMISMYNIIYTSLQTTIYHSRIFTYIPTEVMLRKKILTQLLWHTYSCGMVEDTNSANMADMLLKDGNIIGEKYMRIKFHDQY